MNNQQLAVFDSVMTLVAHNIQGREATPEESVIIDTAWTNAENSVRALAWLSREGKTWKHLTDKNGEKFTSFEQYGKERFGYEKTNLHDLANAYRVQNILKNSDMSEKELPLRSSIHLSKLSDAEIPEVYQQAIERALMEGKKIGAKHVESVVAEYLEKNQTLQKRIDFLELDQEAMLKENDELRNVLTHEVAAKVDAKLAIERATLILENSQALQNAQKLIDDAQDTIERLQQESADQLERFKKEKDKAIRDGISLELSKRETELRQLDYQVESLQKQAAELRQARDLLDTQNGIIKQHQESIKDVGGAIQDIKAALYLAKESGGIPIELMNAWDSLSVTFNELVNEFHAFCGHNSMVIDGDTLTSDSTDDFDGSFNVWGNA